MGAFDDLPDEPATEIVRSPRGLSRLEREKNDLRIRQDAMLKKSLAVVEGALAFADIDTDVEEPPEEWVEELGEEGARKKLRLAKAAQLPEKFAPMGMKLALKTALGIEAIRAGQSAAPTLNVAIVMPAPAKEYDVIEVNDNE